MTGNKTIWEKQNPIKNKIKLYKSNNKFKKQKLTDAENRFEVFFDPDELTLEKLKIIIYKLRNDEKYNLLNRDLF